ncbi:hypothetical protein M513_00906 [Trichuris suis]|uniref:Uncharacterized protein n=1 Tax=Trichuris suis TaxID=68888 RepID=A0A085MLP7_9BILA|nr:hypothetical protein M513_00906 [Trichuris suis]
MTTGKVATEDQYEDSKTRQKSSGEQDGQETYDKTVASVTEEETFKRGDTKDYLSGIPRYTEFANKKTADNEG